MVQCNQVHHRVRTMLATTERAEDGGRKQLEMCEVELPGHCSLEHYETAT